MKTKKQKPSVTNLLSLAEQFPNEQSCIDFLAEYRWHGKPVCPHCGCFDKVYILDKGKLFKCGEKQCGKKFSVKVGTIFSDSALPLRKWFFAMFLFLSHKKGVSSHQLARDLTVTQKTAWFMLHRIRYAMKSKSFDAPVDAVYEVDETYVGSKPRKGEPKRKRGRNTENKTPVVGVVERKTGQVRTKKVERVDRKTLHGMVEENVIEGSTVMTDEYISYKGLDKKYEHQTVNHGEEEFARDGVHVNTMEGFWSQMKRGIFGIYHHVSDQHLEAYSEEFGYRYTTKGMNDADRFKHSLGSLGSHLTYNQLTGKENGKEQQNGIHRTS